jgi:hypothetical protein
VYYKCPPNYSSTEGSIECEFSDDVSDRPLSLVTSNLNILSRTQPNIQSVCPPGNYFLFGHCTACPSGQFQPYYDQTSCYGCPAGTFSTGSAQNCTMCNAGQYQLSSYQSYCKTCPSGQVSTNYASTCTPLCPAGTYFIPNNQCFPINAGCYGGAHSISSCPYKCIPGTYSVNGSVTGAELCSNCPPGQYSLPGAKSCSLVSGGI